MDQQIMILYFNMWQEKYNNKQKGKITMIYIKEYGVKETWDNKYETYAYVKDYGNYLTPIT